MIPLLITGVACGLSAGLIPGPLLAFILAQTIRHGRREGLKGCLAPLLTDPPIMVASILFTGWLAPCRPLLGLLSALGGLFVLYLGWECLRASAPLVADAPPRRSSLARAVLLNALNPNPYLFWFLVGGPQLVIAWERCHLGAAGFALGFFVCVVGAMGCVVLLVERSRSYLVGGSYRYLMIALGIALFLAALMLLGRGLSLFGWIVAPDWIAVAFGVTASSA